MMMVTENTNLSDLCPEVIWEHEHQRQPDMTLHCLLTEEPLFQVYYDIHIHN